MSREILPHDLSRRVHSEGRYQEISFPLVLQVLPNVFDNVTLTIKVYIVERLIIMISRNVSSKENIYMFYAKSLCLNWLYR